MQSFDIQTQSRSALGKSSARTLRREGWVPAGKESCYTCRHEVVLKPCDQLTLPPGTKHWFQAREGGAVFYSFSTCVRDGLDRFTDPAIVRQTVIVGDETVEAVAR